MSRLVAAVVPSAPLLVPALAGGSAAVDAELRQSAFDAVGALLESAAPVVVVGLAPSSGACEGTWDWGGFGVRRPDRRGPVLPLALSIGAWLLDRTAADPPRSYLGVEDEQTPEQCRELGERLRRDGATRLLVVGGGSARRTEKAPGHLDPRAEPLDAQVEQALRAGRPERLLALPAAESRELLADGRAGWQVLAGAAGRSPVRASVTWSGAPYGVAYYVGTWDVD